MRPGVQESLLRPKEGPKQTLRKSELFLAGRLGDWTSSIPHPGRESFLLTWQRRKLETQGSPGTTT